MTRGRIEHIKNVLVSDTVLQVFIHMRVPLVTVKQGLTQHQQHNALIERTRYSQGRCAKLHQYLWPKMMLKSCLDFGENICSVLQMGHCTVPNTLKS